ncbi:RNA-induced silencing complex, nuclease component Tudor-SN [Carpediemonas membranifera]|uniref:RNA-induced silencing complex, nuclease component Tudor-SN n=1 Tax=Carpediemonas membranifera TaxID=201153 RepID=A0A8J6AQ47_9EUKA|nr:RNA-induced silencing complex, nuclease component Tudor-SN [Carpediemonas membranifera]|eukprot:KAG9390961.1 RNA-induced silencing complex, nuclease component Tudor-SN [Carpediemonas membranifera]
MPFGRVYNVLSGDSLVLVPSKGAIGPSPPKERVISLAFLSAPRARRDTAEPFAIECREELRKRCIGKQVKFEVIYSAGNREFCQVWLSPEVDAAMELLHAGYAKIHTSVRENQQNDLYHAYVAAEQEAKEAHAGMWGAQPLQLLTQAPDATPLIGKTVNAVPVFVMNGSFLRIQMSGTDGVYTTPATLAGVACPSVPKDDEPEDAMAVAAKIFTESHVLGRDVDFQVTSVDRNGGLIGVLSFAGHCLNKELLALGYGTLAEWSARSYPGLHEFRAAEKAAQAARKNIWASHEPAPSSLQGSGIPSYFEGTVVKVASPTSLVLSGAGVPPDFKLVISSVKGPAGWRMDQNAFKPEPWAWEAREVLRSHVGKKCKVTVDYMRTVTRNEKEEQIVYGTVKCGKHNLAEQLVKRGLAIPVYYRNSTDERSPEYDNLLEAERRAKTNKAGRHSGKEAPVHFINNLSSTPARVKEMVGILHRDVRHPAIVEHVIGADRYRLFIPSASAMVVAALNGVRAPSTKDREPYSKEAHQFATETLLMRDVEVTIRDTDPRGTLLVALHLNDEDFATTLISKGLAKCRGRGATNAQHQAEEDAMAARVGLFAIETAPVAKKEATASMRHDQVILTHVVEEDPATVYLRPVGAAPAQDGNHIHPLTEKPRKNAVVAAKVNGSWLRMSVTAVRGDEVEGELLDVGKVDTFPVSALGSLPAAAASKPRMARRTRLAFTIAAPDQHDEAFEALLDVALDAEFRADVVDGATPEALLYNNDGQCLNEYMVGEGLLVFTDGPKSMEHARDVLKQLTADAKGDRRGIWRFGDWVDFEE